MNLNDYAIIRLPLELYNIIITKNGFLRRLLKKSDFSIEIKKTIDPNCYVQDNKIFCHPIIAKALEKEFIN